MNVRWLRWIGILAFLLLVCLGGTAFWGYAQFIRAGPLGQSMVVVVPRGAGVDRIAGLLAEKGVIASALVFRLAARTLAADKLALMRALGFERFAVIGHDRGARVAHRLCLDHPQRVAAFGSITVIPTVEMWARANKDFGLKSWHWFMLAQPFDLPERLLAADPAFFLDWTLRNMVRRFDAVTPEAHAEYLRAFSRESVRHAMIEDYRAAASIDLEHDEHGRATGERVRCPVHVLWERGRFPVERTPVHIWRDAAAAGTPVSGGEIDCGHLMMEEAPEAVLAELLPFLRAHWPSPGTAHPSHIP